MHDITFTSDTHTYTVDGVVKRSVTQMLKDAGIIGEYLCDDYYRDRGTRTHDACTLLAQGWITVDMVDDDIEPFVTTFQRLLKRMGLKYKAADVIGYNSKLDYCGSLDMLVSDIEGRETLLELKTGEFPMWGGLQLAAYESMDNINVNSVMGFSLKGEGKVFVPAHGWFDNHKVLDDIHSGRFDLEAWQQDKKRRRMNVLKEL